jgi:hypothetical protein
LELEFRIWNLELESDIGIGIRVGIWNSELESESELELELEFDASLPGFTTIHHSLYNFLGKSSN